MLSNRQHALEFYADTLSDAEKGNYVEAAMNDLGRRDVFFLLTKLLHRKDANKDWLYEQCKMVQEAPNGYLDLWARDHYKMLSVNELVPTPEGWAKHGDLRIGDFVFGSDGKPVKVIATTEVFTDGPAFEIEFTDGTKIKAGKDHLWVVEEKTSKRVKGTKNKRLYREKKIISTGDIYKRKHSPDKRIAINAGTAIVGLKQKLLIEPYLLGAWLGDGHSGAMRITCAHKDSQIIEEIAKYTNIKETNSPNTNSGLYSVGNGVRGKKGTGLTSVFRKENLLNNKHIPIQYKRASQEQRLDLLQGLMDTDGSCDTRGTATYVSKSLRLIKDVFELCASLGLNPKLYEINSKGYVSYRVCFQSYIDFPCFRLKRKLERSLNKKPSRRKFIKNCMPIKPEPMSCIQVEAKDGVYLVSENFIPTHNSTIITFAKTIQDVVDSHSEDSYWWNEELTAAIFSHTGPIAKAFLTQIKREFETNELLKLVYEDVLWANPEREAPLWSVDKGIIVKRKTNPKEATIEAHGLVDGQPISRHYRLRIYDDVVTEDSVGTPEQIKKTTKAYELSINLGSSTGDDVERLVGTRYHFNDTYRTIMEREGAVPRIHPATHDGTPTGKPVFLEPEVLRRKRIKMGPYTYACQMLQNPRAEKTMGFEKQWIKCYETVYYRKGEKPWPANWNYYLLCDPAGGKNKDNDYTSMGVVALAPDQNKYLVDGVRDRMNLRERTDLLFELHSRYDIKATGYEKYGKDSDIEHIEEEMERREYRFEITPLGGNTLSKEDRIRKLVPDFSRGGFFFPHTIPFTNLEGENKDFIVDLIEEYEDFPVGAHDDMMDMLARIKDPKLKAQFPKKKAVVTRERIQRNRKSYNPLSYMRR